jgi:hypothetical protein
MRVIPTVSMILAALAVNPAAAQPPVLQGVGGIQIEYKEPQNPAHRPIYDRLKKRQVLEEYKEFMSPLQLRRTLTVGLKGCNGVINAMYTFGAQRITYCYELIADMANQITDTNVLPGFRREDAVVGGFVSTLLHETGHALFHLLNIPIFGREEDAADAVASYVALQFGSKTARRILTGTAFVWRASELAKEGRRGKRNFNDYSDEHGTDAQRFYNTVCVALGSDLVEHTNTFQDFAELLPEHRRNSCAREYLHVKNSFARFILPHVDRARLKQIRSREWLRNEDGTDIVPPRPTAGPQGPGGTGPSGPGGASPTGPGPNAPGPMGPGSPRPGPSSPSPSPPR